MTGSPGGSSPAVRGGGNRPQRRTSGAAGVPFFPGGEDAGFPGSGPGGPGPARLSARVTGHVQGVGFRMWVRARADKLGLAGSAANMPDGSVEVIAEGPRHACEQLLAMLRGPGTPGRVRNVTARWGTPSGRLSGFAEC